MTKSFSSKEENSVFFCWLKNLILNHAYSVLFVIAALHRQLVSESALQGIKLLFFRIEIPHWIETKSCQLPPLHVDMCLKSSRTALSVFSVDFGSLFSFTILPQWRNCIAPTHTSFVVIWRLFIMQNEFFVFMNEHIKKKLSSIISSLSRRLRLVAMTWRSEVEEVPNKKQPQRCCVFWSFNSATHAYPLVNCFEGFRVSNQKSPPLPLSPVPVRLQPSHFDVTREIKLIVYLVDLSSWLVVIVWFMGLRHFTVKKTRNIIWIVHHIISDMKDAPKMMAIETEPNSLSPLHLRLSFASHNAGCTVYTFNMMMNVVCKYTRAPNDSDEAWKWKFVWFFFCFSPWNVIGSRHLTLFIIARSLVAIKNGWESFPTSVCMCVYLKCLLHTCARALNRIFVASPMMTTWASKTSLIPPIELNLLSWECVAKNANTFSAELREGVLNLRELYFDILIFLILHILCS